MNISARLFTLTLFALLPTLAVQGINEFLRNDEREREIRSSALSTAEHRNAELDGIVNGIERLLGAVAELPISKSLNPVECTETLGELAKQYRKDLVLAVADRSGTILCASIPGNSGATIGDRNFFVEAVKTGKFATGDYTVSRINGEKTIPFAHPIRNDKEETVAVAVAYLSLDWFAGHLRRVPFQPGESLLITDRHGTILAELPSSTGRVGKSATPAQLAMIRADSPATTELQDEHGKDVIYGYVPITVPPPDLYILFGVDREHAFAPLYAEQWRSFALSLLSLSVALALAWAVGANAIRRPIERLLEVIRGWQRDDYQVYVPRRLEAPEFRELGESFNQLMKTLRAHEKDLSEANRFKGLILAIAGHDLRQPLQILMAVSRLRSRAQDKEDQNRYLAAADEAVERLNSQLDALVTATRLDEGPREHKPVAIGPLLQSVVDQWGSKADQKGLRIRLRSCDEDVLSDPILLEAIIRNLIGNAITYTVKGGILVCGRRRAGRVWIEIYDSGIGIPKDKVDKAFGKFGRLNSDTAGLGLGLWIARTAADTLGHELSVCSIPGHGSRFRVEAPLASCKT
ncbi:MAG: sensor histidine kinase [Methylocystis sp.]|uniref:sensor histidine kinase n=1 Tax=Methylocystis sp. TaxID=1911079 RepID=UPI003DA39332